VATGAMIAEIKHYWNVGAQYSAFLRTPRVADPVREIGQRRANKRAVFLDLAKRAVFDRPENPYHSLFAMAGCEYGDLVEMTEREGLDASLERLYDAGVRLTHAEFKGFEPIRRGGKEIPCASTDFSNPLVKKGIVGSSSGSRSRGTPTRRGVEWMVQREAMTRYQLAAVGLEKHRHVGLLPMLPAFSGLTRTVIAARDGRAEAWFTLGGSLRDSWHYRAVTTLLILWVRLHGVRGAFPRYLAGDDFGPAAEYVAELNARGVPCIVDAIVSPGVRLADAARAKGLDLSLTTFFLAGEALTNAKRAVITATGATVLPTYIVSEIGLIGTACQQMTTDNCVHVMDDGFSVFSRRRTAPLSDTEVDSLVFTSMYAPGPYFLINVEMDDAGTLEPTRCDCGLTKLGYTTQLRNVFSYGKLTGQGTTLVGTDILRILEEALPARFGGSPSDYQLVEMDGDAQSELELRVHPRVGAVAVDDVHEYFLSQIKPLWGGALTRREWKQTGGVRVVIAEPYATKTGKVLALHLMGLGGKK